MAARTKNDMLIEILEFLSVMKPSRRREVKEQLDALMKYDNSEFRARFRLSKLTVHHLPSELVCHTVHPPSFCNIIRSVYGENLQKFRRLTEATDQFFLGNSAIICLALYPISILIHLIEILSSSDNILLIYQHPPRRHS